MKNRLGPLYILLFFILAACHDPDNPLDWNGNNYNGYPTYIDANSFELIKIPEKDGTMWVPQVLVCSEILGAAGYEFELDDADDFSSTLLSFTNPDKPVCDISSVNFTIGRTYFWRVRLILDEFVGEWFQSSFSILDPEFSGIEPATGAKILPSTHILYWYNLSGADFYYLQITKTPDNIGTVPAVICISSEYRISESINVGEKRYWRICAVKENGEFTGWSETYNFEIREYVPGDPGQAGGLVFYIDNDDKYAWDYLEAAPYGWKDGGDDPYCLWGGYGTDINGDEDNIAPEKNGLGSGLENTEAIVFVLGAADYAAYFCFTLELNGYNDWFLPSIEELVMMEKNLYQHGYGGFSPGSYWSSTEWSGTSSEVREFPGVYHASIVRKNLFFPVRPARTFSR